MFGGALDFCGTNVAKQGRRNQHSTDVKTNVRIIALTVAMCAAAGATAQTTGRTTTPAADTVLLSERVDGDYLVRTYRIQNTEDVDYSIRYRISVAKLNAALNGNTAALDELNGFVNGLMQDTTKKVRQVIITGYASPDGPAAYNAKLAMQRATDFKGYVDQKYGFSQKYAVTVNSSSTIPDRAWVLQIIDGTQGPSATEQALKRNAGVWNYLAQEILPPMRRVEVMIDYDTSRIVEQRTLIQRPKPAPKPAPAQDYVVVEENVNGMIVEMPEKEFREERREMKQDERAAARIAKREAREAAKIARAQEKAAKAKKTYKDLEKM